MKLYTMLLPLMLTTHTAHSMHTQDASLLPLTKQETAQITRDIMREIKFLQLSRLISMRNQLFEHCFDQKYEDTLPNVSDSADISKIFDPIKGQIVEFTLMCRHKFRAEKQISSGTRI